LKRYGYLLEQITAFENLWQAFRLAKRGCGATPAVCRFAFYLEPELLRLQAELQHGTYQPGRHRYFTIHDPKRRTIAVAPFRDRVVHHAIVRALTPIYERVFIFDSYATRPGKGTHAAIRRAQTFLRRHAWYWKTDIDQYFDSVDHAVLLDLLERKMKDRAVLALLARIIRNTPVSGKGLPIGNLTSQFLANVYLDPLDHAIKERLRVPGYVRYMDDLVLFAPSRRALLTWGGDIAEFVQARLHLRLKAHATLLNRAAHGLSFLGMRIFPNVIRMKPVNRRRSLKRLARREAEWAAGELDDATLQQSVVSLIGHLRYFQPTMRIPGGTDAE